MPLPSTKLIYRKRNSNLVRSRAIEKAEQSAVEGVRMRDTMGMATLVCEIELSIRPAGRQSLRCGVGDEHIVAGRHQEDLVSAAPWTPSQAMAS